MTGFDNRHDRREGAANATGPETQCASEGREKCLVVVGHKFLLEVKAHANRRTFVKLRRGRWTKHESKEIHRL